MLIYMHSVNQVLAQLDQSGVLVPCRTSKGKAREKYHRFSRLMGAQVLVLPLLAPNRDGAHLLFDPFVSSSTWVQHQMILF
jgi:hypothetical protein